MGVPVVLLHAFPLSSGMWAEVRVAGEPVLTPDQRGFGAAPLGDDDPSLDVVADDVAALLDRHGLARVVLGGISMGGYVAMAFARRHADRLLGLALIDTKASADSPEAAANRERIAALVEARGSEVLVEEVLPSLLGETTAASRPAVVAATRSLVQQAPPAAVAWAQRAMAARPESFDVLGSLTVPALVVVGDEDRLSPPAEAQAMVDVLPQGRLAVIPRAGHLTALEAPAELSAVLGELLASLD